MFYNNYILTKGLPFLYSIPILFYTIKWLVLIDSNIIFWYNIESIGDAYFALKEGNFLGELVSTNKSKNTKTYELKLPTDSMFSKVHGDIKLHYIVYEKENVVMLNTITPEDILSEGHQSELVTFKGVMVSKEHSEKDMFKINLLNMLQK